MRYEQARFDAKTDIDFLIIGAGAAGGIIAKELSAAGFRVVVLEQGPYIKEPDFEHDELKYTRQYAITNWASDHIIRMAKSGEIKSAG